jgi:hypothetical protein
MGNAIIGGILGLFSGFGETVFLAHLAHTRAPAHSRSLARSRAPAHSRGPARSRPPAHSRAQAHSRAPVHSRAATDPRPSARAMALARIPPLQVAPNPHMHRQHPGRPLPRRSRSPRPRRSRPHQHPTRLSQLWSLPSEEQHDFA